MIPDLRRSVIVLFKGDESDLKRATAAVRKEIAENTKAVDGATKKMNDHGKSTIDVLGKIGLAWNGLSTIVKAAQSALTAQAERMRLESAAAGVSIDRLSIAAGGLLTRTKQLEIAARLQHGAFVMSEQQMITVERAMRQLTREGNNQEEVIKKVTDAVTKLEDGGLKDFGIQIKETHSDAEKFTAIMEKLAGKSKLVGDGTKTAAESVAATGVSMEDSFDKVKESVGRLVVAMKPFIDGLAKAVEYIAKIAASAPKDAEENPGSWIGGVAGLGMLGSAYDDMGKRGYLADGNLGRAVVAGSTMIAGGGGNLSRSVLGDYDLDEANARVVDAKRAAAEAKQKAFNDAVDSLGADIAAAYRAFVTRGSGPVARAGWTGRGAGSGGGGGSQNGYDGSLSQWMRSNELGSVTDGVGVGSYNPSGIALPSGEDPMANITAALNSPAWKRLEEINQQQNTSLLEKHFGKLTEFDAYATAFNTLTGAVTSSLNAWIDGSESMSDAFRHAIGESLKALAGQLLIEGLKHGAYALGSLAFGDLRGAGQHAAAAAAFGAGAVVAAATAKTLNADVRTASAGSGSSGGSAGGGGGGRDANGNGGDRTIVIVTGNDIVDETQRMKQTKARRYVELGLGSVGYGVDDQ